MFKVIRKQFLTCSAQKSGSYVVMHSLHQLCFCLQPYSRVSTTFKPKFKLWDFSRLRFSSKKRSARYIVFCKKCWIWNIRSTRHCKRRGTQCDILAFLISFSCNSIQESRAVRHYESRVCNSLEWDRWEAKYPTQTDWWSNIPWRIWLDAVWPSG